MNISFETEALLNGLRTWVECESPTWDAAAVGRMMDLASRELALMGARIERIAGRMGFGDCVRATLPHPDADQPGILVLAHLDTVHPVGTLAQLPFRREGDHAWGPGIQDMKGGTYTALAAVRATRGATKLPVTVLLTSDEEVGSPSTRDLIEAEASRARFVLVPEPARPDGGLVTGRYAIARFNLKAIGRPSHAGARLGEGRSAIREMAKQILAIEAMTTEDATCSVGVVHAGQWVNCVATTATAESLSMAKRQADLDAMVERMLALKPTDPDLRFEVTRGVTRPVWEMSAADRALFDLAKSIAAGIGFTVTPQSAGGGSDGNFTGAMGIPTLDGLGVMGRNAHTLDEHIDISSLVPRALLFAGLLTSLGT